ncbi:hypothetical protein RJ639_006901 [Escallonia herrerae]|uniref:ATP synthase subunit O, mitochondrial n=1 Tax=Escallonia herrerae TaxID=1293975 RepID=A0AA88VZZ2_9ASTE|nr:hypothetical protein RJ639_006901 [Escallonia herrerae]
MVPAGRIRSGLPLLLRSLKSDSHRSTVHRALLCPSFSNSESSRNISSASLPKEQKVKVPLALYGGPGNYASALYIAAVKANALDKVESELIDLVEASKKTDTFSQFMKDLSVPADTRVKAINEICAQAKFSDVTKQFLVVLAENGRLRHVDSIAKRFAELTMAHKGEVKVIVTTVIVRASEHDGQLPGSIHSFYVVHVILIFYGAEASGGCDCWGGAGLGSRHDDWIPGFITTMMVAVVQDIDYHDMMLGMDYERGSCHYDVLGKCHVLVGWGVPPHSTLVPLVHKDYASYKVGALKFIKGQSRDGQRAVVANSSQGSNAREYLNTMDILFLIGLNSAYQPLPAQEEKELKETLQDILGQGKKVKVEQKIDPSILGGLMVEFGQKVFDMSIRTRARKMERFLRDPVNFDSL